MKNGKHCWDCQFSNRICLVAIHETIAELCIRSDGEKREEKNSVRDEGDFDSSDLSISCTITARTREENLFFLLPSALLFLRRSIFFLRVADQTFIIHLRELFLKSK